MLAKGKQFLFGAVSYQMHVVFLIIRSQKFLSVIKKMNFYAKRETLIFRNDETVRVDDGRILVGMNSTWVKRNLVWVAFALVAQLPPDNKCTGQKTIE